MKRTFKIVSETEKKGVIDYCPTDPNSDEKTIRFGYPLDVPMQKTLFTLVKASQNLYNQTQIFGLLCNYPENTLRDNFSVKELQKEKKQLSEDELTNRVIFAIAYSTQQITLDMTEIMRVPKTPMQAIKETLPVLKRALEVKKFLKLLDQFKLAPKTINKESVDMAKEFVNTLNTIKSTIPDILKEKLGALKPIVLGINALLEKITTNFQKAIKEYENQQAAKPEGGRK